eukprot:1145164-Pelagomonas_calceolata.AAC.1
MSTCAFNREFGANSICLDRHTQTLGLRYANSKTGCYSYYQSLLPHVDKKISNAFRNIPYISSPMKRTILQYRTGSLYNQKHVVCFKRSTNPLCPLPGCHQLDSALHMLSGRQNHIISSMKTERHDVAGRMIIKALRKSPWGAGLVNTDIGSEKKRKGKKRKEKLCRQCSTLHIIKEKRIPRAKAPSIPLTKRTKERSQWGSGRLLAHA